MVKHTLTLESRLVGDEFLADDTDRRVTTGHEDELVTVLGRAVVLPAMQNRRTLLSTTGKSH